MPETAETRPLVRLSEATLADLSAEVDRPRYDRRALTPGIVHIGVGNFHRAHQAWYLHRLMQKGLAHDWAIIGAGVRPADAAMRERLAAQDFLTTLIELDPAGRRAEVIGSMIDFLPVEPDNASLIETMSRPEIRIVSLTVTEGGYFVDPATGAFDASHLDIRHDAAQPDRPRTAFGAIVAALARRRAAGHPAFTVQSCDNLQGNGAITRQTVLSLARMIDPVLADWIEAQARFPDSMVDCIVPATGPAELELARTFGIVDAAPVTHENFRQWVIEDGFSAGRPPWEEVGVTLSDNVHAYERMKIRILNAGHQVLANAGELLGLATIADCMADPDVSGFWRKVEVEEILPQVDSVPEFTPERYLELIARRFANPEIRDTTRRVAFDGAARHSGFVLPIVRERRAAGRPVTGLALVEALWARMCAGCREDGSTIEPNDPRWSELAARAQAARDEPRLWLEQREFYGTLADDPVFSMAFSDWLAMLWRDGTRATLRRYRERPMAGAERA